MDSKYEKIRALLEKYGEEFNEDTTWKVQNTPVIYHAVLERIAVRAGIKFGEPRIIRAERDECVLLVNAWLLDADGQVTDEVWTFGEALIGVNYRVSGKQAAYTYSMSEKRGRDRAILKLLGITDEAFDEQSAYEKQADERYRQEEEARRNDRRGAVEDRFRDEHRRDSRANGHRLPQNPDDAIDGFPADRQNKAKLYAALNKLSGAAVDQWEQNRSVRQMLASLSEVDRLDIERFADERKEL